MIRRIVAVAQITVLETLSRKHLYILFFILTGLYFYLGRIEFFQLNVEASFIRLVPITGLSIFGILITVLAAARQLPDETQQKTIFPLLAKPLTRFEFLAGKYLGVSSIVAVAMLITAAAFHFMLHQAGIALNRIYWQAVILQILQVSTFSALVLALSTVLSYAANIVVSFLLYYLLGMAGATLEDMIFMEAIPAGMAWFYKALLLVIPRLDLFNISKAVLHGSTPQSWTIVAPFIGYALCWSTVFLGLGAMLFRRKDL